MAKISSNPRKISELKKGEAFVQLSRELLCSDAWRTMPINCSRLINFLIIEHINHAGQENGFLIATYNQLHAFGINRAYITATIKEAEQRGLVIVERKGRLSYNKSYQNRYTLTFLKTKHIEQNKNVFYAEPTHNWKKFRI